MLNNINEEPTQIKKRIFLGLLLASIVIILVTIISGILIYFNKFGYLYRNILLIIIALLSFIIFLTIVGLIGIVMTLWHVKIFYGLQNIINMSMNIMFPIALSLGKIFGISEDVIKSSYIEVNNQLVKSRNFHIDPNQILILAPHCLQKWDCPYKITTDVSNCRHCGKCDIDKLCQLANEFKVHLAVVTGGTLARKIVKEIKPKAIVAIACERDLTEGILDTRPLPVIGVLNSRPEGPCKNTKIDVEKVREALSFLLNRSESYKQKGVSNPIDKS